IYRAQTGVCERVLTPGLWVGILTTPALDSIEKGACRLEPGDVLLLYTDGLIEARNVELGLFGVERLCQSLVSVAEHPATAIRDHILAEVAAWTTRQRDDLSLVVLRYRG